MSKRNLVLIGMPSSGKSTLGKLLAEKLDMEFVDTDTVIKQRENKALRDIVNEDGLERFLKVQEDAILELILENCIIATGGSVIYGNASMQYLGKNGTIIFLKTDYSEIEQRVSSDRRFARGEGQSLQDLYSERMPLYEKYADVTIECSGKKEDVLVDEIKQYIKS